jgi:predicted glycosyltransferase
MAKVSEGPISIPFEGNVIMEASPQPAITTKRIWIDLDNSPHVPFFAPIIEELKRRGYSVTLTARDAYQVWELADFFHLTYARVGRHYGKHRILKVLGTCFRALQLISFIARKKPDLAVAHGSSSQTLASVLLGIPSVAIFDYEFTNVSALFRATWLMVPEVVAHSGSRFDAHKLIKYPGIKEDVYAPGFTPDQSIRSRLGLNDSSDIVITVRPPATEAHYHNPESDKLFNAVMHLVDQTSDVKVILLPRNSRQALALRKSWPELFSSRKVRIPEQAVDGLNLIWHSDLVISGGGTMNREAAALGVPVYSIFRGKIGAVDRYLADTGRLVLLESEEDVRTKIPITRRRRVPRGEKTNSSALRAIVDNIVSILESKCPVGLSK